MEAATVDLLGAPTNQGPKRGGRGKIPAWAARYGYGERQIKNWLRTGREAKDPAPLDQPDLMPAWFARHYSKTVPAKLLEAIEKHTGSAPETPLPETKAEPFEKPDVREDELSIESQLRRFRESEATAHKLYIREMEAGNSAKANFYLQQQRDLSSEVRQLEKALPVILEQRGEFIRTSEVRRTVTDLLLSLKRSLTTQGPKAERTLRATTSTAEFDAAWRALMADTFEACCAGNFADPLSLE